MSRQWRQRPTILVSSFIKPQNGSGPSCCHCATVAMSTRLRMLPLRPAFLCSQVARSLKETTLTKYNRLCCDLLIFAEAKGLARPDHLTVDHLSDFRATWPNKNWSALKKWEDLRTL
jgi:hypothetical protein